MNVRLKKSFGWYSGVVYEDQFLVNHYSVEFNMLTVSPNNQQQNLAYERMKYWIYQILDDSILINQDHPRIGQYRATGARVIALPDEPVDQIMGIMLYLKLNAVMENRMVVTDTELWSKAGDGMSYIHSHGEGLGEALGVDGWWTDARPVWYDARPQNSDTNIVNLDRVPEWKDRGLEWDDESKKDNAVVFAKFNRDDDDK